MSQVLELKEGVVINEDGSEAHPKAQTQKWVLRGILAAFAIPLALFFGLIFLGGFLSLAAIVSLLAIAQGRFATRAGKSSRAGSA